MAITVVGSVYNIPEADLLTILNQAAGTSWSAGEAEISGVAAVTDTEGVITSIRVSIEAA